MSNWREFMKSLGKYAVPLGRICFSLIFILSSYNPFAKGAIGYAASQGVPMANILVPIASLLALIGGLSVLLGYKTKAGAWMIVLFLIPVTFTMHAFWKVTDPGMRQIQQIMFLKNIAMLGGALMLTYFGSGPCSLGSCEKKS